MKSCFVLMPFAEELRPIYDQVYRPVVESLGLRCWRVDDSFEMRLITEQIVHGILDAQILLSDLTQRNPNVFYELGICHTAGKKVVLTAQDGEDIPFDIASYRVLLYENTPEGFTKLSWQLTAALQDMLKEDSSVTNPVTDVLSRAQSPVAIVRSRVRDKISAPQTPLSQGLSAAGLIAYSPVREQSRLIELVESAETRLSFLGTSLPDMASDRALLYLSDRLSSMPDLHVRILLLDPFSFMAVQKNQIEVYAKSATGIIPRIHRSLQKFRRFYKEGLEQGTPDIRSRFQVRVYRTIPTTSLVFNDWYLDVSFYDEQKTAAVTPAWLIEKNSHRDSLYDYYWRHFSIVWDKAVDVLVDDYQAELQRQRKIEIEAMAKARDLDGN